MVAYGALQILPIILLLQTGYAEAWTPEDGTPDPSFKSFSVIKPVILHGRSKREIFSTRELDGHVPSITVAFQALGTNYLLDLELNRDIVSRSAPLRYQRNGSMITDTRALNEDDNCYYSGHVRGSDSSSVAMSTCEGISGLVFDGRQTMFVSSGGPDGRHYLYREDDLVQNRTCGVSGPSEHLASSIAAHQGIRVKRSSRPRGPYNSDRRSRYVELVLVVDQAVYHENGDDLKATIRRTKQIANIVNSLYTPLNIFVALVGVEVWTEFDKIALPENSDTTLANFLQYRREHLATALPNDNAQLLTGVDFEGNVVGKALKGPICTYEHSGGVNMDHSKQVSLVATTVAHEMGHNFGMEHDTDECDCKDNRCIMSPSSSSVSMPHWSKCSRNYLAKAFSHGMDSCLRNKPASLYDSPVCGNGFVEPGEQCDCGTPGDCKNPCCDAPTCMLKEEAVCATGQCCDLTLCRPKKAGVKCRGAEHECDLSEYCTGNSEYCPDDVHKQNGLECQHGESYCYDGRQCRTRDEQCEILWGPSVKNSVEKCYHRNSQGSRYGNCGYDLLDKTYQQCQSEDVMCGMLHCAHRGEQLLFGRGSAAQISASFIYVRGIEGQQTCRTALIDLGLGERDPGLVPNGAPCGHGKMCVDQKCAAVGDVTEGLCPDGCGYGVCNSLGHCHCDPGWGPPHCLSPGDGGSVDSGPALDSSWAGTFMLILFVVFLGLVPAAAIIFCCVYILRSNISPKKTLQPPASGAARYGPGWANGRTREAARLAGSSGGPGRAPPPPPVALDTGRERQVTSARSGARFSLLALLGKNGRTPAPSAVRRESPPSTQASGRLAAPTVPSQPPPPASLKATHNRLGSHAAARPAELPPPPAMSSNGMCERNAPVSVVSGRPPPLPAASLKGRLGQVTNTASASSTKPPPLPGGRLGQVTNTASASSTKPSPLPGGRLGQVTNTTSAPSTKPPPLPGGRLGQVTNTASAPSTKPPPLPAASLKSRLGQVTNTASASSTKPPPLPGGGLGQVTNTASASSTKPPPLPAAGLKGRLGRAVNTAPQASKELPCAPAASLKPGRSVPGAVTVTPPTPPPPSKVTCVRSDPAGGVTGGRVAELRARLNLTQGQ